MDETAVVVAIIAAVAAVTGSYFSYRASTRLRTGNGKTTGQQVDKIAEDVSQLRIWFVEHLHDHAKRDM